MRICIDCRSLCSDQRTGVGQVTYHIVEALLSSSSEHEYILFTSGRKKPTLPTTWAKRATHVHRYIPNKLLHASLFLFYKPYIDDLCEGEIDWVISPNLHFSALSKGVRSLLIIHDISFVIQPQWYSFSRRLWHYVTRPKKQIDRADAIMVPSKQTREDLQHYFSVSKEKIIVTHWGVIPKKHIEKKTQKKRQYFLFVGTLEPRKHVSQLLDAYEQGEFYKKGVDLILAGSKGWSSKKLQQRLTKMRGVTYRGYVDEEEKDQLYAGALALIYPTLYEGFGLPPLEAMSHGTPVIMSHSPGVTDVCGIAASLIDPHNVQDLVHAMQEMHEDESLRNWYSRRGKEHSKRFSWNNVVNDIHRILV